MGLLNWFKKLFKKKSKEERAVIRERKELLFSSTKINSLLDAAKKQDDIIITNIFLGGRGIGLRCFTQDLNNRYYYLDEQIKRSGKNISLEPLKVYVDKLILLLSPRGEIRNLLRTKPINWKKLKEKVNEARNNLDSAIAEEEMIFGKL